MLLFHSGMIIMAYEIHTEEKRKKIRQNAMKLKKNGIYNFFFFLFSFLLVWFFFFSVQYLTLTLAVIPVVVLLRVLQAEISLLQKL